MAKRKSGDVLAGRYRLVAELGRGGMGEVWRAEHLALRSVVAVKLLGRVETPEAAARFEREAQSAAALRSPHVVQILDHGVDDDTPFIVMELLEGETLAARLRRVGRLAPEEAMVVLTHVARALSRAHELGIVHRDLKPDNVFLVQNDDETVGKVLDFGIAKVEARDPGSGKRSSKAEAPSSADKLRTQTGMLLGTPAYMSPEQARAKPVDARSDLWSLAIIAYECLCGRPPFDGDSITDILVAVMTAAPPAPSSIAPVPPAFDAWFAKGASRDPAERFASAKEMIEALRVALEVGSRHIVRTISTPPDARAREAQETLTAPTAPPSPARGDQETLAAAPTPPPAAHETLGAQGPPPSSQDIVKTIATLVTGTARSPRRRIVAALGAAAIAAGVYLAVRPSRHAEPAAPPAPPPLAAPASVLACPILEASGVEGDAGWLGAGAATIACERARVLLGGASGRTLVPAELFDLPRQPVESFPEEPYATPAARARSLEAASRRAAAFLDGALAKKGEEFEATFILRRAGGAELGRASGVAGTVYAAVRRATDALVAPGLLPKASTLDEHYASWFGVASVDDALLALDAVLAIYSGEPMDECERVDARGPALGPVSDGIRWQCAYVRGRDVPALQIPALDPGSNARYFRTGTMRYLLAPQGIERTVAEDLRARVEQETWPCARALLATLASNYWQAVGDDAKAHNAALLAVQADPRCSDHLNLGWWQLAATGEAHAKPVARAFAAWRPGDPTPWQLAADADAAQAIKYATYANVLAPRQPLSTSTLFDLLLAKGRREEGRALAVRLETGKMPTQRAASVLMFLRLEAAEARVAAAHARALAAVRDLATAGGYGMSQRLEIATWALGLAQVLGRGAETADALVGEMVDPEPPRLDSQQPWTGARLATVCALARKETASRCFGRLRELAKRGFFSSPAPGEDAVMDGAEAWAKGDLALATKRWRPLLRSPDQGIELLAFAFTDAFDAQGEPELAEKVDAAVLARGGAYNGADLAHVRAARRAAKRGDKARARELARKVVDAWSVADEVPPSVAEMKKLLAKVE